MFMDLLKENYDKIIECNASYHECKEILHHDRRFKGVPKIERKKYIGELAQSNGEPYKKKKVLTPLQEYNNLLEQAITITNV
jgi:hypothetical protein